VEANSLPFIALLWFVALTRVPKVRARGREGEREYERRKQQQQKREKVKLNVFDCKMVAFQIN
jgi:hypothetical protein